MNYEDIIAVLEWEDKCDKESKEMTLEDKIKNAKPSDLFDNIPKKKQRLIIQKNKRRLKRLKRRINNEN